MSLKENTKAPDFELLDQSGISHQLSDYLGQWVLLYFYPKDDTPGCTTEACDLRDQFSEVKKYNTIILGVSADSVKSHEKFATKYKLPFSILADEEKKVVKLYDVWAPKKFMGREFLGINRVSFLIDPKGIIVKVYDPVKASEHASEVLSDLKELTK
ncbi:MAG: thioredoxin-dependent thiol peroxidase [Candidatus Magasanikbacteria bacterium]|nr:thioredoxin-dependent thiol peroxidase [Candidatus Magasanikbacteria bacterium]